MPNLIGTGLDQVPMNGMLGDFAFQNKESIEFTGGSGALSHLDIAAINATKNITAYDVFVYDTSKDSDGGAWRKRTQHTSWYNEELNTSVRGSRREFPSVAVIVVQSEYVTIYDGDDASLPMWMGFANASYASQLWENAPWCTYALNGKVAVGSNPYDLNVVDFIADNAVSYSTSNIISGTHKFPISGRAPVTGTYSLPSDIWKFGTVPDIIGRYINDVAMTVLPGAPIDVATGLPIPTIAVATENGVSIIKDNGTVVDYTSTYAFRSVAFSTDNKVLAISVVGVADSAYITEIPIADTNTSVRIGRIFDNSWSSAYQYLSATTFNDIEKYFNGSAIATSTRLILNANHEREPKFQGGEANPLALVAEVTSKYSTGWMSGDIKGAWLADTTQETLVGTELITNGTFNSDLSGWNYTYQDNNMFITYSSGKIRLVRSDSTGTQANPKQIITTIPGRAYVISYDVTLNVSAVNNSIVIISDSVTGQIRDWRPIGSGTHFLEFVATGTQTQILIAVDNNNDDVEFDNISVRLADRDRTVNARSLQTFGNITKTPVATGADLVAYSGWSGANYFKQQYNSAINFGTGDFFAIAWHKSGLTGTYNEIFDIAQVGSNSGRLEFLVGNLGNLYLYASGTTNSSANGTVVPGMWNQLCAARRSGVVTLYVNGVPVITGANTGNINNANSQLFVGINYNGGNSTATDQLALLRLSATAPSADQIRKMYEDEKVLFQDNAKAVLYGTSDAVTALAYDAVTEILHVGTSSGRSDFQGLRRIDNTTRPIGTAISAVDSFIVEE